MKYSGADLIGEERYLKSGEASWRYKLLFKWLASKDVTLHLRFPETYLKRCWLMCDDIKRYADEEIEPDFILSVLVESFLTELAKRGSLLAYEYLMERYSKVLQVAHYQSKNIDEFELFEKPNEPLEIYTVSLDRDAVYRLEWFLMELDEVVQTHGLTVEKVLEILFCYVIDLVKKGGGEQFFKRLISFIEKIED
ncbi:hypothetical protein PQ478_21785 (plasmid) [Alkalihalophilus pseudofirmus]|uniref:hypothetical protein n=1 Tax=Alkalihalophilus pseudofirmus TaxID=79885 RepID=UPI00259B32AA|nr:hypothetical protein [Alkalihalophilus pseudofirmus]WEG19188.1 hypothetical protein PQ478_21785 [Alkalihalophilus pseudofirmus]